MFAGDADVPVTEERALKALSADYAKFLSEPNLADISETERVPRSGSRATGALAEGGYAKVYRYKRTRLDSSAAAPTSNAPTAASDNDIHQEAVHVNDDTVVVKRSRAGPKHEGVSLPGLREVAIIAELDFSGTAASPRLQISPRLIDFFVLKGRLHCVMSVAQADLAGVLSRVHGWVRAGWDAAGGSGARPKHIQWPSLGDGPIISADTVACLLLAVLLRLRSAHSLGWLHRDLKPGNILLQAGQEARAVEICDWGMAERTRDAVPVDAAVESSAAAEVCTRLHGPDVGTLSSERAVDQDGQDEAEDSPWESPAPPPRWEGGLHPQVVTLAYRAPELLLAAPTHGPAIDMWAAGATEAEIVRAAVHVAIQLAAANAPASEPDIALAASAAGAGAGVGSGVSGAVPDDSPPAAGSSAPPHASPGQGKSLWRAFNGEGDDEEDDEEESASGTGASSVSGRYPDHTLPLFHGRGDLLVLAAQAKMLGPPDTTVWPSVASLPGYMASTEVCPWCEWAARARGPPTSSSFATPKVTRLAKTKDEQGMPPLPAWAQAHTVAASCANTTNPSPAYHAVAIPRLGVWLGLADLAASLGQDHQDVKKMAGLLDLLLRCLAFDPTRRITAAEACEHPSLSQPAPASWPAQLAHLCLGLPTAPRRAGPAHPGRRMATPQEATEGQGKPLWYLFDDDS